MVNNFSSKYTNGSDKPSPRYKSKIDYYINNDHLNGSLGIKQLNGDNSSPPTVISTNGTHNHTKYSGYQNSISNGNINSSYNNNHHQDEFVNNGTTHCSNCDSHFNGINNKPPVSPNGRLVYSPTPQQHQSSVQIPIVSSSFRSISSQGPLLVIKAFFWTREIHT